MLIDATCLTVTASPTGVDKDTHYPIFHIAEIGRGKLYAAAKPPSVALQSAMEQLQSCGITAVLSLLEPQEASALGLQHESEICHNHGIEFIHFPVPDFGIPETNALKGLVARLHRSVNAGQHLLVHCRGGIGRTGTVCSCLLTVCGMDADTAIALVSEKRGREVPETPAQTALIRRFS